MLGLDNPIHILFLLVIVLLVFGAKRLPEMGKSLGEGLRGFKDSVSGGPSLSQMAASEPSSAPVDQIAPATPLATGPAPDAAPDWSAEHERTPVTPGA
jgi:sec-independent protein translocase protein TatA